MKQISQLVIEMTSLMSIGMLIEMFGRYTAELIPELRNKDYDTAYRRYLTKMYAMKFIILLTGVGACVMMAWFPPPPTHIGPIRDN